MTIITNQCYGGFHLPQDFCDQYGLMRYSRIDRTDPRLIQYVRDHGGEVEDDSADLVAVEIPDSCTDWELTEYDGMESITYVVGGKLFHA